MANVDVISIPSKWKVLDEKYDLKNDQGLNFLANVLTEQGDVISIFKADESIAMRTYEFMIQDYAQITNGLTLKKKFNIKLKDLSYPIYIIGDENGNLFAQSFLEKEGVFSFVTSLKEGGKKFADYQQKNPVLGQIIQLMRQNI